MIPKRRKQLIIAFISFIIVATIISIIFGLTHHASFTESFPFGLVGIFVLAYLSSLVSIKPIYMDIFYFILYMITSRIWGGYVNWTSWVIFAVTSGVMTFFTAFLRATFTKPENNQHQK